MLEFNLLSLFIIAAVLAYGVGIIRRKRKIDFGWTFSCAVSALMLSTVAKASAENVNALVLHLTSGNQVDRKSVV